MGYKAFERIPTAANPGKVGAPLGDDREHSTKNKVNKSEPGNLPLAFS